MTVHAKDVVDTHLASTQPDSVTPESTTASGITHEHALYDTPPKGSQSAEFRQGRRKCHSTERGGLWVENFSRSEGIRKKGNRTRKINSARRSHEQQSQAPSDDNPQKSARTQTNCEPSPEHQQRGRNRTIRRISRLPTPGSTDQELEETTQPPTFNLQYVFVYKTLDHEGLVEYAQKEFGINGHGCDTQTILAKLRLAEAQQTTQVGSLRQPSSINVLPGQPLQVGSGWQHEYASTQLQGFHGVKRAQGVSNAPNTSNKKQRIKQAVDNDPAAESKTDKWLEQNEGSVRVAAEQIPVVSASTLLGPSSRKGLSPSTTRPSPPPPVNNPPSSRSTPTTVPATQDPRSLGNSRPVSFYGRSTTPNSPVPPIPTLLSPPCGSTHTYLQCYFERANDDAEATPLSAPTPAEEEDDDGFASTDAEEPMETDINRSTGYQSRLPKEASSGPFATSTVVRRTSHGTRSHLPSQSQTNLAESNNNPESILHPSSRNLTPAELIRRERTQAVTAKALTKTHDFTSACLRARPLFVEGSAPPIARPQSRPLPGASGVAVGAHTRGTRRIDPVGGARANMIAFNEACVQQGAHSFVESTTRQSKHTACQAAPSSRPRDKYLEDDEELLAQAKAFAKKKWPNSSAQSRLCNRKPKPLARDVSGIEQQVLVMAKIHLFVYALVQGIYQTRATFIRWAASVHYATWQMELPTTPYQKPLHDIFEIMVNNIATVRGKVKEHLRAFTAREAGFEQRQTNQRVIQKNLRKFNLIYPNSFHCKTYCPRKGHYENPEIGQCLATALFNGPSSVGVMYPDYFKDMPLTVVAFVLAMWQFCIEEWSNGWHQNGDLGMAAMREKYEAQLAGLKELRDVAPRQMDRLQTVWQDHVMEYSGAQLKNKQDNELDGVHCLEMRPDTPEPQSNNAMSTEEVNNQLFETACQMSLQVHMQQLIEQEECKDDLDVTMDEEEDNQPQVLTEPSVEYDLAGRLTAHSKGKGRAN